MSGTLQVLAPDGVPEIGPGDDLGRMVTATISLRDGDVVLVTSKVVSKAEGRVFSGDRDAALSGQTSRLVARAGRTMIVRNPLGLTMAAAGIDESNIEPGYFALLPEAPDDSARSLRETLHRLTGCNVAVVVTDTSGRAWRRGQTDVAIGAAGLGVVEDLRGQTDHFGTALNVTLPAVADELASAAELAAGKLTRRPLVRIRGRADLVLPPGEHGPGAGALIRAPAEDLFGYGAREAVMAALRGGDPEPFGQPAEAGEVIAAIRDLTGAEVLESTSDSLRLSGADRLAVAVAFAHGWVVTEQDDAPGPSQPRWLRPHQSATSRQS